jgi:hypothetical protein
MIAAAIPWAAVTNHFPLIVTTARPRLDMCLLANLNSLALDYITRQKIGGVTLNFFIVEQLPVFPPEYYREPCPWNARATLEKWISERVLKLTCTSLDMQPVAEAAGLHPSIHPWNDRERAEIMAELDAAFFVLYGIERPHVEYILTTFSGLRATNEPLFSVANARERVLNHYDELRQTPTSTA